MPHSIHKSLPLLTFTVAHALEEHMSSEPWSSKGFWLRLSKTGAPEATISKSEAIEAALCCGWIDGQIDKLDKHYFLVRMTPRRSASRWSAKNRETAERLSQQNRIKPAGLAEIKAAKSDGRWDAAYLSQSKAEIPLDLAAALASNKTSKRFFDLLDRANRYSIIYRVNDAKRAETRARRIADFVEMLARGEKIYPSKSSKR